MAHDKVNELKMDCVVIGEVTDKAAFEYKDMTISGGRSFWKHGKRHWKTYLKHVPVLKQTMQQRAWTEAYMIQKEVHICSHKIAQPTVFIPVFPGTNCEYDSTKAFERAGAKVITKVFKNLDAADIRDSVDAEKAIDQSQMIMFQADFSAGDELTVLQNSLQLHLEMKR